MRIIEVTQGTNTFRLSVDSVKFVEQCPYNGDHEFLTEDPRQHYCVYWHAVNYRRKLRGDTNASTSAPSRLVSVITRSR